MNEPGKTENCTEPLEMVHNKRRPLTEQEKWQCTARWLNALYTAFNNDYEIDEERLCPGCIKRFICPCCFSSIDDLRSNEYKALTVQSNFKVLERFTGPGTIEQGFPLMNTEIL